ncbi:MULTISPECIES: DUF3618 domain-containing protein [Streptomyces]|uniref:DUF3618 domain-containing protein n=1 Tax=Streptomyces griseoaurantiacus TaxID=68213 RepID=A0A1G7V148_9ACTN|nr:Protein of unknown function [Streptomyces jietaisiensis]
MTRGRDHRAKTDAGQLAGSVPASGRNATGAKGPEELLAQIEETRGKLGDTVAELAGKTDVKGRARARAEDLRDRAGAMTVQLRSTAARAGEQRVPLVLAGVGAGAVVAAGVWWGRRGGR